MEPLLIALGSNAIDSKRDLRLQYLERARDILSEYFNLVAASRVYESTPVEYLNQPNFLNQVLQFEIPAHTNPLLLLHHTQYLETRLGRVKSLPKGPRTIDIDILFMGNIHFYSKELIIPHPSWKERSFVLFPLRELPFAQYLNSIGDFPEYTHAYPTSWVFQN